MYTYNIAWIQHHSDFQTVLYMQPAFSFAHTRPMNLLQPSWLVFTQDAEGNDTWTWNGLGHHLTKVESWKDSGQVKNLKMIDPAEEVLKTRRWPSRDSCGFWLLHASWLTLLPVRSVMTYPPTSLDHGTWKAATVVVVVVVVVATIQPNDSLGTVQSLQMTSDGPVDCWEANSVI